MEFNSDFSAFLIALENEPGMVVIWAALIVPFSLFLIAIPAWILKKVRLDAPFEQVNNILTITILASWITGFISQIMLLFIGVSGIRMLFIWVAMFVTYLFFSIFNYRKLIAYFDL